MSIDSKEFQKILDDFYGTASVQGSTKQEERDLIAHIDEKMQLDALDAARYRWLRSGANHNASWLVGTYAQEDLDAQLDAAMKEPATREDDLTVAEAAFVELVKARPGCKLGHEQVFGENTHPLWRKPEALGLVECVGSYKWKATNKGAA